MEIKLSNGEIIDIKKIGIFDLDQLVPATIGPFTYISEILGVEYDIEFDPRKFKVAPTLPEIKDGEKVVAYTPKWWQITEYNLYHAALTHETKKQEGIIKFYESVKEYIFTNCIKAVDRSKIKTTADWLAVYSAVLVEQLTLEKIAQTLNETFNATFQGVPILEALNGLEKGHGSVDTVKLWEIKLMTSLSLTELEYSLLSLEERSRKVCALFLDDIMAHLEAELQLKEIKKK